MLGTGNGITCFDCNVLSTAFSLHHSSVSGTYLGFGRGAPAAFGKGSVLLLVVLHRLGKDGLDVLELGAGCVGRDRSGGGTDRDAASGKGRDANRSNGRYKGEHGGGDFCVETSWIANLRVIRCVTDETLSCAIQERGDGHSVDFVCPVTLADLKTIWRMTDVLRWRQQWHGSLLPPLCLDRSVTSQIITGVALIV
jgi:hypothetical protein